MNFKVGSVYRLGKKIGSGAFGDIYIGLNTETHEEVAVKIEQKKNPNPQLLFESKLYSVFQGGIGIPRMYWYGVEGSYNVLVMELLGPNLEDMFNYCCRSFSLKTILMLAQEMITRLEFVHSRHFIHRDIKPENFLVGSKSKPNVLYVIDFGLSKKYCNPLTKAHIKFVENKSLTGTPRYASLNNHLGLEQSRRDDLESLGFVLMYFLRGKLPWQGLNAANKKQKYERITRTKQNISFEELCKGYPAAFCTYLHYCRALKFEETPNYEYLRNLFSQCMEDNNYKDDGIFDWMDYTVHHDPNALPAHMKDNHGNLIPEYLRPAPVELRKSLTYSNVHSQSYSSNNLNSNNPPMVPSSIPPPHSSYNRSINGNEVLNHQNLLNTNANDIYTNSNRIIASNYVSQPVRVHNNNLNTNLNTISSSYTPNSNNGIINTNSNRSLSIPAPSHVYNASNYVSNTNVASISNNFNNNYNSNVQRSPNMGQNTSNNNSNNNILAPIPSRAYNANNYNQNINTLSPMNQNSFKSNNSNVNNKNTSTYSYTNNISNLNDNINSNTTINSMTIKAANMKQNQDENQDIKKQHRSFINPFSMRK